MNEIIEEKLKLLPSAPGVYKMYDSTGTVIYVGKAISLKNRVRQYFQSNKSHTSKVTAMVSHIADFDILRTANETEALSLECNLIKQFKPKYNILLKDDKHFPYVRIDMRQDFPRVEVVRRIGKDGARYLGPFLSAVSLRDGISVVRENYPIRHCKKDLKKAIARNERPCLMYHIGKCCAPCSGNVSREAYHGMLEEVCSFLSGHTDTVVKKLAQQMDLASDAMEFEKAALLRDRIRAIEGFGEKQAVIATSRISIDVFALGRLEDAVLVFALFVRDGKVIGTEKFRMDAVGEEDDGDILAAFLKQYYMDAVNIVPEILTYQDITDNEDIGKWLSALAGRNIYLHRPLRGEKVKLVQLAYRNCVDALDKDTTLQKRAWERGEGALAQLAGILELETLPMRMECFDNSHIQGRDTVSSMVVFTDGQPDKKAYRRFRVQSDVNGDDVLAMRETLTRRFQRALDGDPAFSELPDLLIVDGGQTQLNAALEVLKELSIEHIPTIGLAETREVIYQPGRAEPILLPRNSAPLHLLERTRDEAHRFAITYHRSLRQKNALFSILDEIDGIGDRRKRALFDNFTTLDAIRAATIEQLCAVEGITRPAAEAVYRHFHTEPPVDGGEKNSQES